MFWIVLLAVTACNEDSGDCIDPSKINEKAACPYVIKYVCGCDGKTYSNSCVAENSGIVKWTEGKCP
jgi:hypothetical protein